jgi:glycosyltransferase involved in cell wall biosynthesis
MLEPWSLKQSRLVKRLALWLYQGPCLQGAACIQCTAVSEAQNVRSAGYRNPIALIKFGIEIPQEVPSRSSTGSKQPKKALFLSRIHPKKGLLNLVTAWSQIRPDDWQLAIVGPDEGGHLAEVQRLVSECGLQDKVIFLGEAVGEEKLQRYAEADLFVLPTFSENFGAVIGEALSCCVPVITTRAAPWEALQKFRCGWWIEVGVEPLVAALKSAFNLPLEDLRAMGLRGRRFVEEEHSWKPIGQQMAEVYKWVAGRRSAPSFILT